MQLVTSTARAFDMEQLRGRKDAANPTGDFAANSAQVAVPGCTDRTLARLPAWFSRRRAAMRNRGSHFWRRHIIFDDAVEVDSTALAARAGGAGFEKGPGFAGLL